MGFKAKVLLSTLLLLACLHALNPGVMSGATPAFSTNQCVDMLTEEGRQQWEMNPGSPRKPALQASTPAPSYAGQLLQIKKFKKKRDVKSLNLKLVSGTTQL